ncbi:hypothetical protein P3L10_002460 [Capsicum annuum]
MLYTMITKSLINLSNLTSHLIRWEVILISWVVVTYFCLDIGTFFIFGIRVLDRKSTKLPTPIFISDAFGKYGPPFDHRLGFGYDRVSNDYKVVRIVLNIDSIPPYVEVYKLSTDVWTDITHVAPSYQFYKQKPGVYVNGAYHWVAIKSKQTRRVFECDDCSI